MNHILALAVVLASSFPPPLPSANQTAWMRPESFRLRIGMSRNDALEKLKGDGWKAKPGKNEAQLIVDYSEERSLTLEFHRERLHSVQFELFGLIPPIREAFKEEKTFLSESFGAPKKTSPSIVLYDNRLPNVMVVLQADPKTENGRKGLGLLVVRYFDPVPPPR